MFVSIQTVRKNDTIRETYLDGKGRLTVEKGPATKVYKAEHGRGVCSKLGTHINDRECFDSTALVWRERGEFFANNGPSAEDWDIDNNIPVSDPRSPMNPDFIPDAQYPLGTLSELAETTEGLVMSGTLHTNDPRAVQLLEQIFGDQQMEEDSELVAQQIEKYQETISKG